jgi:DNA-binding beta-propeller fold protein YncE
VVVENDPGECSAIINFCDEEVMYMITGSANTPSTLYTIDPATGAVLSTIGATGQNHFTGIGVNPITKVMYGFRNIGTQGYSGELYTIDPQTGAATLVGPCPIWSPDLAFSPSGVLYAWAEFSVSMGNDFLCTIDQNTGAVTMVGDPGIFTTRSGLAFTPSGDLYLKTNGILYELNPANGAVISSVPFAINATHNMLTFDQSGTAFTGERNAGFCVENSKTGNWRPDQRWFECNYQCHRH